MFDTSADHGACRRPYHTRADSDLSAVISRRRGWEDEGSWVSRRNAPLESLGQRVMKDPMCLQNAVGSEAAAQKPLVGGLDRGRVETSQWHGPEIRLEAANVELVILVGTGADPIPDYLWPAIQKNRK